MGGSRWVGGKFFKRKKNGWGWGENKIPKKKKPEIKGKNNWDGDREK